jgi:hypothetical protein
MQFLKADTNTEVLIGPVVAVGDGFTPVTTLSPSTADEAELIKYGGASALTVTSISGSTMTAISGADGYYTLDISTGNTDTEGFLTVLFNDDSLCLPVRHDFMVVNANVYDSLFAAATTDYLQTDAVQISSDSTAADNLEAATDGTGYTFTSCVMPTTTAVTNTVGANVTQWLGSAAAPVSQAGVPEVDITYIGGSALSTTTAQLGVNVEAWNNTSVPADVQAGYPTVIMKTGTGSGELDITSGTVDADVVAIGGNAQAATNLSASARSMQILTVNTGNVASSTTTAQFDSPPSEVTADHFIGRKLFFYDSADALFLQGTSITDSSWDASNSEIALTFQALTEAPSDGDVAILV